VSPSFWWGYFLLPAAFTDDGTVQIHDVHGKVFFQCPSIDAGLHYVDTCLAERQQCAAP